MSRASGSERARRSSLVTTSVSPCAARGQGLSQARAVAVGAGEAVVDVDALGVHAERREGVALGGEVLGSVETRA